MATVKNLLFPNEAIFQTGASFPQVRKKNGSTIPIAILGFDAATDESAYWITKAYSYGGGDITLKIYWYAESATSGSVVWESVIAAITPEDDSQDVETKAVPAVVNYVQDTHLGTTGKRLHEATITITGVSLDSLSADDMIWIKISRDADGTNGTDDMTGDANLVMAEISYSDGNP